MKDIFDDLLIDDIVENQHQGIFISTEIFDIEKLQAELKAIPNMKSLELSSVVTTHEAYELGVDKSGFKISVLDLGVKRSILDNLLIRDCHLKVFPAKTSFGEMRAWNADGYFISNGP